MSYFSRLTDIVTCNLTEILSQESNPKAAIQTIVREMEEGLAGAKRSVSTANGSVARLNREIGEHQAQADQWMAQAKEELQKGNEAGRGRPSSASRRSKMSSPVWSSSTPPRSRPATTCRRCCGPWKPG